MNTKHKIGDQVVLTEEFLREDWSDYHITAYWKKQWSNKVFTVNHIGGSNLPYRLDCGYWFPKHAIRPVTPNFLEEELFILE